MFPLSKACVTLIATIVLLVLSGLQLSDAFVSTIPGHKAAQERSYSHSGLYLSVPFPEDLEDRESVIPVIDFVNLSPAQPIQSFLGPRVALLLNFLASSPLLWVGIKTWTGLFWKPYTHVLQTCGVTAALLLGTACTWLAMNGFLVVSSLPILLTSPEKRQSRLCQYQRDGPLAMRNNVCGLTLLFAVTRTCTSKNLLHSMALPSTNFLLTFEQYAFIAGVNEVLFYFLHKLQHTKGDKTKNPIVNYLRKIHVRHHTQGKGQHAELLPIGSAVMHPVEYVFVVGISAILGPALLPGGAYPALAFSWYMMAAITAILQHAGWTSSDMGMHKHHHDNAKVNLGVYGLLDCVYGTLKTNT